MNLNPHYTTVMRLILDQGIGAAEQYVLANLTEPIEIAKAELERLQQQERDALNIIATLRGGVQEAPTPSGTLAPVTLSSQGVVSEEIPGGWRNKILEAADEISPLAGDVVQTKHVIDELIARGLKLPGTRPGTSIGNILNKDGRWERISEGVFRRK